MALNKIISEGIKDSEVKLADMADDSVGVAELSATGTASNTTFLRGDNAWATPTDTTTPADGTVTEAKLNANAPTNDHVLTADSSAAGGFKWAAASGGVSGISSSADATAMTIDSSENVGIQTTAPQYKFEVDTTATEKTSVGFSANGESADIRFRSNNVNEAGVIRVDESSGGGIMNFWNKTTGGTLTHNLEIQADGDVQVKTGNLIIGTNAKGIDFTANTDDEGGAGSVSAELLNDYERGTWTPAIVEQGGASYTYGTQDGWYIKIGDLVYVGAYIKITASSGTTSANSHISGFPFSTPDAYNCFSGAYHYSVSEAGGTPKVMRLNGTQLEIFKKHEYSHAADNEIWENGNERFGFGGVYHTS